MESLLFQSFKGIVQLKMTILPWFTHPHIILNLYDFCGNKRRMWRKNIFKKKKKMLIYIFGDRGAYMQNNIDQAVDP